MRERFPFVGEYPCLAVPDPYKRTLGESPGMKFSKGEAIMFEVTEEACRVLKDVLAGQHVAKALRILMQAG